MVGDNELYDLDCSKPRLLFLRAKFSDERAEPKAASLNFGFEDKKNAYPARADVMLPRLCV